MHMGMNLEDPHQIGKKHNLINTDKFTKDPYFCVFADIGKNCLYNWLMYTLCSVLSSLNMIEIPETFWTNVDKGT